MGWADEGSTTYACLIGGYMRSIDLLQQFDWHEYSGQTDSDVTYFFRAPRSINRLRGESDIFYIGKTEQSIRMRYEQETRTINSPKNTQQTNIRTTYIYQQLEIPNPTCYFTKSLVMRLSEYECSVFLEKLKTWDKKFFLGLGVAPHQNRIVIPVEKYLLISYADEHLEVPPLNNRV